MGNFLLCPLQRGYFDFRIMDHPDLGQPQHAEYMEQIERLRPGASPCISPLEQVFEVDLAFFKERSRAMSFDRALSAKETSKDSSRWA